jgi:hypothetical protein
MSQWLIIAEKSISDRSLEAVEDALHSHQLKDPWVGSSLDWLVYNLVG